MATQPVITDTFSTSPGSNADDAQVTEPDSAMPSKGQLVTINESIEFEGRNPERDPSPVMEVVLEEEASFGYMPDTPPEIKRNPSPIIEVK
jgi:hypothetical protein